jgi:hypothetical protein
MNAERTSTNSKMKLRRLYKKKRYIKIKKTTQDVKEKYNKDMESLRKKNQNEILKIKSSLNQLKNQLKATPANWNKWKIEFQGLKTK